MSERSARPLTSLSNPHDRFAKQILSEPERASDFLNNYLTPQVAASLDLSRLKLAKDSFVDSNLKEYFTDLLYHVRLKRRHDALVYVLIEHKSAPDEWVAFQVLRYMVKIWEPIAKKRAGKLPPIVPLVLYHGKSKWNVARNFGALIDREKAESLTEYVPEFQCQVCDLSQFGVDQLRGDLRLRVALLAMKNVFRPGQRERIIELLKTAESLPAEDGDGLEYLITVLRYYLAAAKGLRGDDFREAVRRVLPRQEEQIMSTAAEDWIREGEKKGIKEGIKKGIRKGQADLTLLLLERRIGRVSPSARQRILSLPPEKLQDLGVALLDFSTSKDLSAWLAKEA